MLKMSKSMNQFNQFNKINLQLHIIGLHLSRLTLDKE